MESDPGRPGTGTAGTVIRARWAICSNNFYNELPSFPLSCAQKRVLRENTKDAGSGRQMTTPLGGDG